MTENQLNTPDEIWKGIPGFPGYEVSDQGRVRSYRRRCGKGERRGWTLDNAPQLILKANWVGNYRIVTLYKGGKRHYRLIHRLVLETFVGPCPPTLEGCHNDGISTNCYLTNLRWDTPSNNCLEKRKHGTAIIGEKNHNSNLTTNDVKQIRELASYGINCKEISKVFQASHSTVCRIVVRNTWTHI